MAEAPRSPSPHRTGRGLLFSLALALSAVSGCNCDEGGLIDGTSSLRAEPTVIDLGRVFIGTSRERSFRLSAPGEVTVSYETRFEGNAWGFVLGPATGTIDRNGGSDITVRFTPEVAGRREARAIFESNATSSSTVTVLLRAEGVPIPDCEDGNGCTRDSFDLETGQCTREFIRDVCNDFDACTVNDTCVNGVCLGEAFSCDDGDVCTDDFCDPQTGCVNVLTVQCDDGNPCTADSCDATGGCGHEDLPNGTPCDDGEQCSIADICLGGQCEGVGVPEGSPCNDGDPCSLNERCVQGECTDPTYSPPGFSQPKFVTEVGPLARGAAENPVINRNTTFVGVASGVVAIDECGEISWTQDGLGPPVASAMTSLITRLIVPVGADLVELDPATGETITRFSLATIFPSVTDTATRTVRIVDVAVRASQALVVSLVRETLQGGQVTVEGQIVEVDRFGSAAWTFAELGPRVAARLTIDADESVVAVLVDGVPDKGELRQRLVRYGPNGPVWLTSPVAATRTDLALGDFGVAYWTAGFVAIEPSGESTVLFEPPLTGGIESGSPVAGRGQFHWVRRTELPDEYELLTSSSSTGEVLWREPLNGAPLMSPVVDADGNVFVLDEPGNLLAFSADGIPLFDTPLPVGPPPRGVALGITAQGVIVGASGERVFGVQGSAPLGLTSWPRRRRDNLSTGHR